MARIRNAITESRDLGLTMLEIAYEHGLSVFRVRKLLESAEAGYNTPEDELKAAEAKRVIAEDREALKRLRKAGL